MKPDADQDAGLPKDVVELVTRASAAARDRRFYDPDKVMVKFRDDYRMRIRERKLRRIDAKGELSAELQSLLAKLGKAQWLRMHSVDEKKIDEWVATARKRSKNPPGDLNNYYILLLDEPQGFEIAAELMKTKEVQLARPLFKPVAPPQAPDFTNTSTTTAFQGYLRPAPGGIDADFAWTVPGGDGAGIAICDIEYNWNFSHGEFTNNGGLVLLGNSPSDPNNDMSHGTAVVGVYGSNNDQNRMTNPDGSVTVTVDGTTGIAFNSRKLACAVFTYLIYNIAGAITTAMAGTSAGDILLIEQHLPGPNSDWSPQGVVGMIRDGVQQGYVPVEWYEENYDAIRTAVENGFVVVEAAGNGGENLDADLYHPDENELQRLLGIKLHKPFIEGNESGAVIVGAGDSAARSKLGFSNFGRRVDVQGWGNNVVTTDAPGSTTNPDIFNGGSNNQYTSNFSGTSSASPIVAGACAVIQSVHQAMFGRRATPGEVRALLQRTNSAQTGDTGQHIGPLPDLRMVIEHLRTFIPPAPWLPVDGVLPLPLALEMTVSANATAGFNDVKIWFTLDGTDPVEDEIAAHRYTGVVTLAEEGFFEVRASTFANNSLGARVASPVTRRVFQLYERPPAPKNFRASQGAFPDFIRLEWDSIDRVSGGRFGEWMVLPVSTYDVFAVTGPSNRPFYYPLNDQPIQGLRFDYYGSGLAPLVPMTFVVRGTKRGLYLRADTPPEMLTEYSEPARGWLAPYAPNVTASKGEFTDHVRVRWDHYNLGNYFDLRREYLLYRSTQPDAAAAQLLVQLEMTYATVHIGDVERQLPRPAPNWYDDAGAAPGQTYYYWVKAQGPNENEDVVESPLSNMDSGFVRL